MSTSSSVYVLRGILAPDEETESMLVSALVNVVTSRSNYRSRNPSDKSEVGMKLVRREISREENVREGKGAPDMASKRQP